MDRTKVLQKVDELPKIPAFPGILRCRVDGYPAAVTDHYILDMYGGHVNFLWIEGVFFARHVIGEPIPRAVIDRLVTEASTGSVLSLPEFIGTVAHEFYVVFSSDRIPYTIQTKYYLYFYYSYPGCEFLGTCPNRPLGIRHNGEMVGLAMPLLIDIEQLLLESREL